MSQEIVNGPKLCLSEFRQGVKKNMMMCERPLQENCIFLPHTSIDLTAHANHLRRELKAIVVVVGNGRGMLI